MLTGCAGVSTLPPHGWFPPFAPAAGTEDIVRMLAPSERARLRMSWPEADDAAARTVREAPRGSDPCVRARLQQAAIAVFAGKSDDARAAVEEVLAMAPGSHLQTQARILLAIAAGLDGNPAQALSQLEALSDEGALETHAHANRAQALLDLGRLREAEDAAVQALRAGRRAKNEELAASGAFALGQVHVARGRLADARQRVVEALRGFSGNGDTLRRVQCHHLLGEIAYQAEDSARAGSQYRDALGLARLAGAVEIVAELTLLFEHR